MGETSWDSELPWKALISSPYDEAVWLSWFADGTPLCEAHEATAIRQATICPIQGAVAGGRAQAEKCPHRLLSSIS